MEIGPAEVRPEEAPQSAPSATAPERERREKKEKHGKEEMSGSEKREKKDKEKKDKKKKGKDSGRGVETMFRTSYGTHLNLSSQADAKANIMISINGLIISVLLATAYPSVTRDRWSILPTAVLLVTCLVSLVFALMAARPRITRRSVSLDDVRENRGNILFFGTFVNMTEDDYVQGMWELMRDRKRSYTNMMRDLFGLGLVLQAKYRLLRYSYTIFMVGLVLGVGAFLLVYALVGTPPPGL